MLNSIIKLNTKLFRLIQIASLGISCILLQTVSIYAQEITLIGDADAARDTEALRSALNSLPEGGTLSLIGTFHIWEDVYVEGLDGTITGDGITTNLVVTGLEMPGYASPVFLGNNVLNFRRTPGTSIIIKDLTITHPGGVIYQNYLPHHILGLWAFINDDSATNSNTLIERVKIECPYGESQHGIHSRHNYYSETYVGPPESGDTIIVECEISGPESGISGGSIDDGMFSVSGCNISNNADHGIMISDIPNGNVDLENNYIGNANIGITVWQVKDKVIIRNNLLTACNSTYMRFAGLSGALVENNYFGGNPFTIANDTVVLMGNSIKCTVQGNIFSDLTGLKRCITEPETALGNRFKENIFDRVTFSKPAIFISGYKSKVLNNDFYNSEIPGEGAQRCITLGAKSSKVHIVQPIDLLPLINNDPNVQILDNGTKNVAVYVKITK